MIERKLKISKLLNGMTIQSLKDQGLLFFEAVTGSRAYGTDTAHSDTDLRGIFILPKERLYGMGYKPQVSDEKNDEIYYELGRFVELLSKSNPNMLELLAMPEDCIRYRHPLFERLKPELFLSKQCRHTFAGYAKTQIYKAHGLNKKILNPMAEERKTVLEFCYVIKNHGAIPLEKWLEENHYVQERCGLVNIPYFRDTYALFYDSTGRLGFSGVMSKPTANEVSLSSIPKGMEKVAIMSFNKDGYQTYCKEHRQYWEWVEKRNEERYAGTLSHGKNYDAKNMMHTFRLLDMAEEIARYGEIRVRRPNREFLLRIRKGEFDYGDLVAQAEERIEKIDELFSKCSLPERPDLERIDRILVEIRREWYGDKD